MLSAHGKESSKKLKPNANPGAGRPTEINITGAKLVDLPATGCIITEPPAPVAWPIFHL
jgi:hypothetical protein